MIKLETPLTIEKVESLRVGDQVLLSGTIYTGRDAAHKRFVEAIKNNEPLPFDPYDQVIYFVGPTPTKPGHIIGSCGPTTSYRMDAYSPTMLSKGLRGMIGKGRRNNDVKEAMKQYKGVYFGAIGGAGAIIASCIKSCEIIAYEDLGPEAVRRLVVEDLPLTVVIDSEGHDLYEIGRQDYLKGKEEIMDQPFRDYNETDILYLLMTYVNFSSGQDMYYSIAKTILTHLEQIPSISINDLAELCFTSPATISRFCKDLNCRNFATFKKEMAIALEIAHDEIHFSMDDDFKIKKDPQYLVNKVYDDTKKSLELGQAQLDIKDIDHICELIHDAPQVFMIGYQFSRIACQDFQLKMLKLEKFLYAFANRGDEVQRLDLIEENDLVIIVTVRARKELIDSLITRIKKQKARILIVTMNEDYTNPEVDYYYHLNGEESDYTQSSISGFIDTVSFFNIVYLRYGLLYNQYLL